MVRMVSEDEFGFVEVDPVAAFFGDYLLGRWPDAAQGFGGERFGVGRGEEEDLKLFERPGFVHLADGCGNSVEMRGHSAIELRGGPVRGDDGPDTLRHLGELAGDSVDDLLADCSGDTSDNARCLPERRRSDVAASLARPTLAMGTAMVVRRLPRSRVARPASLMGGQSSGRMGSTRMTPMTSVACSAAKWRTTNPPKECPTRR